MPHSTNSVVRNALDRMAARGATSPSGAKNSFFGAAGLAGMAAAKEAEDNRRLGISAAQSAKKAMGDLKDTMAFLGTLAQNGGEVNGVSAVAVWGAVKEINNKLHNLFS